MMRFASVLGLLAVAACVAAPKPVEVGRGAYQENCATCHGESAAGDGRMAVFVRGGVPSLRQLSKNNGGTFPDAHVVRVITKVSDLHDGIVAMPDFGALLDASPTVFTAPNGERIETDATVLAIVDYLKTVQD